jgi:hypothetical protein
MAEYVSETMSEDSIHSVDAKGSTGTFLAGDAVGAAPMIPEYEMSQIEDIIDRLMNDDSRPTKVVLTKGPANKYYGTLVVGVLNA